MPKEKLNILTLTIRLYDPDEERDHKMAATWVTVKVPRADMSLSAADFTAKYLTPALDSFAHMKR